MHRRAGAAQHSVRVAAEIERTVLRQDDAVGDTPVQRAAVRMKLAVELFERLHLLSQQIVGFPLNIESSAASAQCLRSPCLQHACHHPPLDVAVTPQARVVDQIITQGAERGKTSVCHAGDAREEGKLVQVAEDIADIGDILPEVEEGADRREEAIEEASNGEQLCRSEPRRPLVDGSAQPVNIIFASSLSNEREQSTAEKTPTWRDPLLIHGFCNLLKLVDGYFLPSQHLHHEGKLLTPLVRLILCEIFQPFQRSCD
mmetsp:Transcript_10464/g.20956  ORF Transcript_10464/g.20956 Transcript_10464/m.20956 type:complete len:258 (+) Transcript_10464:8368-9141(+)